jgi:hypothetical protein
VALLALIQADIERLWPLGLTELLHSKFREVHK